MGQLRSGPVPCDGMVNSFRFADERRGDLWVAWSLLRPFLRAKLDSRNVLSPGGYALWK